MLTGLVPALVPAKAGYASTESVSAWLNGFAGENSQDLAREKISRLNNAQDEPDILLRKASKIISAHAELFALPVNNPHPTDEEVFNLLMQEWKRYQQTGSMGMAIMPERQHHALPFENVKFSDAGFYGTWATGVNAGSFGVLAIVHESHRLQPLLSGTSINAP